MAVCLATLLSNCAQYHPQPLSPEANAQALDSRTLDDPRLTAFVQAVLPRDAASARAGDWRLTTLTLAALYYHPDISIAQAKLAEAEAAILTAREPPNPTLHLTNVVAQAAVAGGIPAAAAPLTIGPIIDFVIDTSGKRAARTAKAQQLADAARWDITTAEWRVRAAVRDALLQLWAAEKRRALTRQELDLQQQLLELLQHRFEAGEAAAPEVARERIRRAQTVLALSNLERDVVEARARLAAAIGIPVQALQGVALQMGAFDHAPAIGAIGSWRHTALTQRSDVQAGLANYEAAQAGLRFAVANQYPDLTIGPGYNYDLGVNRYILDLGTTLPVFHQEQGLLAEAVARRREAAAEFTKLQAHVIAAIDTADAAFAASTHGAAASDVLLTDERRRTAQVESAFRAGEADRPTLVSAQLVVVAAERARLDAVVQQRQAVGALEDALQRPLYEPHLALPLPPMEQAS